MKVLALFAHPDDEIIFGWPIFQKKQIIKHLICATEDKDRLKALDEVSRAMSFTWETAGLKDMETHKGVSKLNDCLSLAIEKINPDVVITHNFHGEYGHPDHTCLFKTSFEHPMIENLLVTDISTSVKSKKYKFPHQNRITDDEKRYYL